ncbi:MAG: hypothetical protein LBD34_04040 [Puniceicoccales bacterium]|jgi:hypothetical protein|nr:hypothetical protein [Puniceicoccales bacterium]
MSSLENDKPSDTTDLHDFRDSPNPRPFGTKEDTTVPPRFLSLRDVEAPAPMVIPVVAPRAEPCQVLIHGIGLAFFGN